MQILVIKAEIRPHTTFIVQPFTARVARQILFKISEKTKAEWLTEALASTAPNKPYAYTPLYLNGRPLYKRPGDNKVIVLKAGQLYTFQASIILRKTEDVSLLYGFLGQLELYGSNKVDIGIISAEVLDEQVVSMPIQYGTRILVRFETPTLLQFPKLRKASKTNRYLPFPLPSLMFYNLKNHWNTYAQEKVTSSSWRANYALVIENYRLCPCTVVYDANRRIRGFIGWTVFRVTTRGKKLLSALSKLLAYAQLINIGKSRSSGFGVVKVTSIGKSLPNRSHISFGIVPTYFQKNKEIKWDI